MPSAAQSADLGRDSPRAFLFTVAANLVVVFVEAGFNWYLPDDPERYQLLYDLGILH